MSMFFYISLSTLHNPPILLCHSYPCSCFYPLFPCPSDDSKNKIHAMTANPRKTLSQGLRGEFKIENKETMTYVFIWNIKGVV